MYMEWVRHTKERKAISHHVLYGDKTGHGNTNEEHGDLHAWYGNLQRIPNA